MDIRKIVDNKRSYLPLLLLADEDERSIDAYIDRGDLYALFDDGLKSVCVVTDEGDGSFELQNLATDPAFQRKGYASALIKYIKLEYAERGRTLWVGTGDSPLTIPFYKHNGFAYSHTITDEILRHYDHPIYENGVQLRDKVYLRMQIGG
ncbi:MAG: GNAT family N-acetyltransferase [Oscillospiraceae bacterium]|nr:GNAT family N-acetyltransferase [Oscillospiraceae bacterium]